MINKGIREVELHTNDDGRIRSLRIVFGPHYFLEIESAKDGKTSFILGATHHGFRIDASGVGTGLDRFIDEIRASHPDAAID